jgi:archaemetzincin
MNVGRQAAAGTGLRMDTTSSPHRIGILPMGDIPSLIPQVMAAHIESYLRLPADIFPPEGLPEIAFDQRRLQYDAGKTVTELERRTGPGGCSKMVAVLSCDLFVPIFSFVLGEARQGGAWALVSLYRLGKNEDGSLPPESSVYKRTAKVALHEIGHLFDLVHCDDERCLMHFSGGLADLDRTEMQFCRYCRQLFQEAKEQT